MSADLEDLRHHGRHTHLFGTDYRWQHTDGRWTLRRETDDERVQRIHLLLGVIPGQDAYLEALAGVEPQSADPA